MKRKIKILSLCLLCSCAGAMFPLRLQDRTLLIDPNSASLIYPMIIEDCKYPRRRIFKRCKDKRVILKYNLNVKKDRDLLINSGFKCVTDLQFKY